MQKGNDGLLREMEQWCERVDAQDTDTQVTHNEHGNKEIECHIRTRTYDVHVSVDENQNGKVLMQDDTRDNRERLGYAHDWEGDMSDIDLHDDGITIVDPNATFSLNWEDF